MSTTANLDDFKKLLRKQLSVLTDPSMSADPDFKNISLRINECIGMYRAITLDPHLFGANRKGSRPALDINDFGLLVETVIAEQQRLEGVPDRDKVIFRKALSDNPVDNPVITWKIIGRAPGQMDQVRIADKDGRREYVPRLREVTEDVLDFGYSIFHYSQIMDNYVEFCINANDSGKADEVALWFEEIMDRYKWFFSFQGINRAWFIERKSEMFENLKSNLQYKIPMIYFIRTEKTISMKTKDIESIAIDICLTK